MTLDELVIILKFVAWWCNGSTGVFGTLSRGSNPCRAATLPFGLFLVSFAFYVSCWAKDRKDQKEEGAVRLLKRDR